MAAPRQRRRELRAARCGRRGSVPRCAPPLMRGRIRFLRRRASAVAGAFAALSAAAAAPRRLRPLRSGRSPPCRSLRSLAGSRSARGSAARQCARADSLRGGCSLRGRLLAARGAAFRLRAARRRAAAPASLRCRRDARRAVGRRAADHALRHAAHRDSDRGCGPDRRRCGSDHGAHRDAPAARGARARSRQAAAAAPARARAEQPSPEAHQCACLRSSGRRGSGGRRLGHRHRHDGRGRGRQDARHQGRLALRLLVAVADVRIIEGRLIGDLVADGGVFRQLLLVVADAPQGVGRASAGADSARSPARPCRAIRSD